MPPTIDSSIYLKPVTFKPFNATGQTTAKKPAALAPGLAALAAASTAANPQASGGAYGVTKTGQTVGAPMPDTPQIVSAYQQAQGPGGGNGDTGDPTASYSFDPALQGILAAQEGTISKAKTDALDQQRQSLIGFGSQELAREMLGANDPTLAAISDNPDAATSTLAALNRNYRGQQVTLDDSLNKENLWYGGWHGKELGDLNQQKAQDVADATAQERAAIAQILSSLAATTTGARNAEQQAELEAALRAQQATTGNAAGDPSVAQGDSPGAYGIAGNGVTVGDPMPDTAAIVAAYQAAHPGAAGAAPSPYAPFATLTTATKKTGGASANKAQGVFATH